MRCVSSGTTGGFDGVGTSNIIAHRTVHVLVVVPACGLMKKAKLDRRAAAPQAAKQEDRGGGHSGWFASHVVQPLLPLWFSFAAICRISTHHFVALRRLAVGFFAALYRLVPRCTAYLK